MEDKRNCLSVGEQFEYQDGVIYIEKVLSKTNYAIIYSALLMEEIENKKVMLKEYFSLKDNLYHQLTRGNFDSILRVPGHSKKNEVALHINDDYKRRQEIESRWITDTAQKRNVGSVYTKNIRKRIKERENPNDVWGMYYIDTGFQCITLQEWIEQNRVSMEGIKNILACLFDMWVVLAEYHNTGFFHLDVKPENIIVRETDASFCFINDMGAMYQKEKDVGQICLIENVGYSAPELYAYFEEDAPKYIENIDFSTDMYAIGGILYYYITGELYDSSSRYGKIITRVKERMVENKVEISESEIYEIGAVLKKLLGPHIMRYSNEKEGGEDLKKMRILFEK